VSVVFTVAGRLFFTGHAHGLFAWPALPPGVTGAEFAGLFVLDFPDLATGWAWADEVLKCPDASFWGQVGKVGGPDR
jgi:hypothetical protein